MRARARARVHVCVAQSGAATHRLSQHLDALREDRLLYYSIVDYKLAVLVDRHLRRRHLGRGEPQGGEQRLKVGGGFMVLILLGQKVLQRVNVFRTYAFGACIQS